MKIFPQQLKAARALVGMAQADVCGRAGIALVTLRRLESQSHYSSLVADATVAKVQSVLEEAGVIFFGPMEVAGAAGQYGVALRAGVP